METNKKCKDCNHETYPDTARFDDFQDLMSNYCLFCCAYYASAAAIVKKNAKQLEPRELMELIMEVEEHKLSPSFKHYKKHREWRHDIKTLLKFRMVKAFDAMVEEFWKDIKIKKIEY